MFVNDELNNHLLTSPTVKSNSKVVVEWNLNAYDNISKVGNYRYRPLEGPSSELGHLPSFFDPSDEGGFYTGATDSDVVLDGGIDEDGTPILLQQPKQKEKLLYSLEDCFGRFRPRSGINKVRFGITGFVHNANRDMARRPRYYMSHKDDKFKYWSSYRVENDVEYGIANVSPLGINHINDAAPFVVYEEPIATNKIVVKVQTNVGTVESQRVLSISGETGDPLFGDENKTTPSDWGIDVLVDNQWQNVINFLPESTRPDGSSIIGPDGYMEISYGLILPKKYQQIFSFNSVLSSYTGLPSSGFEGEAYLVKDSDSDKGLYYVWLNNGYEQFVPEYGWKLSEQDASPESEFVSNIGNPESFVVPSQNALQFREFQYISGIRVAARRMNKFNSVLDLIEISPRLSVDITEITNSYNLSKIASDLGSTGLPVGQLLASVGSLELFDPDQAFNKSNDKTIVPFSSIKNMQVKIYDVISYQQDLSSNRQNIFYVPIKTMYADSFPEIYSDTRSVSLDLRDLYFYFESLPAPDLLLTNVSLSSAVSTLLDYIGFSNYVFRRLPLESEDTIPFFYCKSDRTVAEVLQDLAVSTQSAMFFDENNNFVVTSKNYMIPSSAERPTDMVLIGEESSEQTEEDLQAAAEFGIVPPSNLPNIVSISSQDDAIFNDGKIVYKSLYIQKSQENSDQAYKLDSGKNWVYKPVLLWEAAGEEASKAKNEQTSTQNAYSLTAIPLKSDLSETVPYVRNGVVVSNILDLGESVYWLGRYAGYFYAAGEIIRFDAVEYSIPNISDSIWITSIDDYQNYFSKISFGGKMFPTGRVRIFSQPNYRTINGDLVLTEGAVSKHGRGQFGTAITSHYAGIDLSWTNGSKINGIGINSKFLFESSGVSEIQSVESLPPATRTVYDSILTAKSDIKQLYENLSFLGVRLLSSPLDSEITSSMSDIRSQISGKENLVKSRMIELKAYTDVSSKYLNSSSALSQARRTQVTDKIKNFLAYSYSSENPESSSMSTDTEMVQASALIMDGANSDDASYSPINHITYAFSTPTLVPGEVATSDTLHTHFGTRMRIIGRVSPSNESAQEANGAMTYVTVETTSPEDKANITGGSGGISGLLNSKTGEGYYFEIAALDSLTIDKYSASNMFFYKVISSGSDAESSSLPQLLWRGVSDILVDGGDFVGQSRIFAQENQTVYDLAFEYVDNIDGTRTFFLYLNGTQVATVTDTSPIVAGNSSALFIRGTSKCMFENIYSMSNNYADSPSSKLDPVVSSAFGAEDLTINSSFSKYAISGLVQSTYLSSIGPSNVPKYNIYYDEFGTIMREAAYLNIKYDKAFPALYSRIIPGASKIRTYCVSSYYGSPYGAEFLVFNTTDTVISLDSSTNSALRIQGITFTQQSSNELTVDEFFNKKSDLSNPVIENGVVVSSPLYSKEKFLDIRNSRSTYGRKEFTIDAPYIQSRDTANSMMNWLAEKIMVPRKSLGLSVFSLPTLQLGDIVSVKYSSDEIDQVREGDRFVIYQIDHSRSSGSVETSIYLSEVKS